MQRCACTTHWPRWRVIADEALTSWLLGRRKLWSYFSLFVDQSSPDYVSRRGRYRSLQRRFPVVDILFRSGGDIRDWSVKSSEIAPEKACFSAPNFLGGGPQILDLVFKIAPISDHVAKFHGDRPRDRTDLALKKKRKKATAAKHKGRHATGGPNNGL